MIDVEKIQNVLIDYCEWSPVCNGWEISDSDMDKFFNYLEDVWKEEYERYE